MKYRSTLVGLVLLAAFLTLTACGGVSVQMPGTLTKLADSATNNEEQVVLQTSVQAAQGLPENELLAAYQDTLVNVYELTSPSVVNIRVVQDATGLGFNLEQLPELPGMPFFNDPNSPNPDSPEDLDPGLQPFAQGLGSGFVWDDSGHIITNNHVVENAKKIEVRFNDGRTLPASLVGADADSDLAVLKIELPASDLKPVTMADSNSVKVGQLAIAIGNPFGLEGTMTVGIVSALGRSLPLNEGLGSGPSYSIPDIVQTDAPINPGNSGGVLLNSQGEVIGVTAAIESPVGANAGIGFVIPSRIVQKVVPVLIKKGTYEHPWIGISGFSLSPDVAKAMDLDADQQGALVASVLENSPAARAGLKGSEQSTTIDGQEVNVGGDVIIAAEGQPIREMDDLIAYLSSSTEVGQKIELTVLRDGQETNLEVTLAARPENTTLSSNLKPEQNELPGEEQTPKQRQAPNAGRIYLGISALPLNAEIIQQMELPADLTGVLVQQVEPGSPAEKAGLKAGQSPAIINGEPALLGGDVIVAIDGETFTRVEELRAILQKYAPEQEVTISIFRDGQQTEVKATLAERTN